MNNTFFYESIPLKDFKWMPAGTTAVFWGESTAAMENRIGSAFMHSEGKASFESFTVIEPGPVCWVMVRATITESPRPKKKRGRPAKRGVK